MSSKINIFSIISGHLKTLKNASDASVSLQDYFTFFILPLLFSLTFYLLDFKLTDEITSLLVNFGAIFTALLLSVLVLVYDQGEKLDNRIPERAPANIEIKKSLLKELYFNICYAIVISVSLVFLCLIETVARGHFIPISISDFSYIFDLSSVLLTPLIVFLTLNLMLTILMVVKRMHALLTIN